MTNLDPQLLELSEVIPIMDELFKANEEVGLIIEKNSKVFDEKYSTGNKTFEITLDIKKSIINILRFIKLIKELKKETYEKVKKGIFDFSVPKNFKQLSDKAFELSKEHVMCFQKELDTIKKLSGKDRDIIENKLYRKVYETIKVEGDVLDVISMGLKKYAKEEKGISATLSVANKKRKIELVFLWGRSLCLKSNKKRCYTAKDPSDRCGYLKTLIQGKGKLFTAKQLSESINKKFIYPNSGIVVSSAISEINTLIKKDLGLSKDIILGGTSYKIDTDKYEITEG